MRPRFSIPTRIFLAFALTLVAFGAIALTSVIQHERTSRQLRLLHDGYLPLALRLGEARSHQNVYRRHVERLLESPTELRWFNAARQLRPSTMRRLRHFVDRAEELATKAGDRSTLPPIRDALDEVAGAYESTAPRYEALVDTLEAGDPARAAESYERAMQVDPNNPYVYLVFARHEVDRRRPGRAESFLEQSRALFESSGGVPVLVEAHFVGMQGAVAVLRGQRAVAARELTHARKLAPGVWGDGYLTAQELL